MGLFRRHPHVQAVAVPGEGIGPDGYGAGTVTPGMYSTRGARLHYDDLVMARPMRKAASGRLGLQLNNGRSGVSRTGRSQSFTPFFIHQQKPVKNTLLPGDRVYVPPSPSQVQGWAAAGAGSIPDAITGNGSVIDGTMVQGGGF